MKGSEYKEDRGGGDVLLDLFRHAAARERPPAGDEQAVRAALHAEWRALTRQHKRRRATLALAAAAMLVLLIGAVMRPVSGPAPTAPGAELAKVERLEGAPPPQLGEAAGDLASVQAGAGLRAGQSLVTRSGSRAALRWRDGSALRIDQDSRLRLTDAGELALESGRVYVDTAEARASPDAPIILTPAGPVRHRGTQYMTAVAAGVTRISVRDGTVALARPGGEEQASGGQQLVVESSGATSLRAIPVHGAAWQWTEALAAPFAADGRSLADFLGWVGRETGHRVEYASAQTASIAASSELRGDVAMQPARALDVVMQTSDLVAEVHDGIISVRLRSSD
jgi:hypothetical protein